MLRMREVCVLSARYICTLCMASVCQYGVCFGVRGFHFCHTRCLCACTACVCLCIVFLLCRALHRPSACLSSVVCVICTRCVCAVCVLAWLSFLSYTVSMCLGGVCVFVCAFFIYIRHMKGVCAYIFRMCFFTYEAYTCYVARGCSLRACWTAWFHLHVR